MTHLTKTKEELLEKVYYLYVRLVTVDDQHCALFHKTKFTKGTFLTLKLWPTIRALIQTVL